MSRSFCIFSFMMAKLNDTGRRIRKTNNLTGVSTFHPVASYEQMSEAGTKHYPFGGHFGAVRSPAGLFFPFQDQVNSTVFVTNAYTNKQGKCQFAPYFCFALPAPPPM